MHLAATSGLLSLSIYILNMHIKFCIPFVTKKLQKEASRPGTSHLQGQPGKLACDCCTSVIAPKREW
jgi:hypothetical protein